MRKNLLIGGLFLVVCGIVLLGAQFFFDVWPLILIGVGVLFLGGAVVRRVGGLAIPGTIIGGLGMLLGWQTLTGRWESWFYVWPLVFAMVGLGLMLAQLLGVGGRRVRASGVVWLVAGVAAVALFRLIWMLFSPAFSWPLIIVGVGAMFLVAAVFAAIPAQFIPGTIIAGIGGLLFWQNLTDQWQSWSYAWALVPCFVGLGLFLASLFGLGGRALQRTGLSMMGWSLVTLVVFGFFFTLNGSLIPYWPVLLVLSGFLLLCRPLFQRAR